MRPSLEIPSRREIDLALEELRIEEAQREAVVQAICAFDAMSRRAERRKRQAMFWGIVVCALGFGFGISWVAISTWADALFMRFGK